MKEIKEINLSKRKANGPNLIGGSFFEIIGKLDSKNSLSQTKLLQNWSNIIGDNISHLIIPIKLNAKTKTLFLKPLNPAIITIISHQQNSICEKINTYFGYEAVIKLDFQK